MLSFDDLGDLRGKDGKEERPCEFHRKVTANSSNNHVGLQRREVLI